MSIFAQLVDITFQKHNFLVFVILMKIPKPYIAVLFNFNKEKLSTDIIYFYISGKKDKKAVAHCRLQFIYEKTFFEFINT